MVYRSFHFPFTNSPAPVSTKTHPQNRIQNFEKWTTPFRNFRFNKMRAEFLRDIFPFSVSPIRVGWTVDWGVRNSCKCQSYLVDALFTSPSLLLPTLVFTAWSYVTVDSFVSDCGANVRKRGMKKFCENFFYNPGRGKEVITQMLREKSEIQKKVEIRGDGGVRNHIDDSVYSFFVR